jgi:RNA polymerase sigma factor (sigma-70 family)
MPPHARTLLAHLHYLAAPAVSDAVLLARWMERRDEAAFAELVGRHGPMVLGVCRRVLGDVQHAEDVFQATFLTLARKAAHLRRPEALPSFLYGIALRLARKARVAAARRSLQPNTDAPEPADPQPHPLDVLSGRELLAIVDEEIARQPEVYRLPLLLCVLQERSVEEAARLLGWSAGSVRGRLTRGRERLRQRLSRRGVTLSVGAIALLAPAALPEHLRAAALRNLAAPAPAAVNALTVGSVPKLKAVCLGLLVLTAGLGTSLPFLRAPEPPTSAAAPPTAPPAQAKDEPRRDLHGDPLPPGAIARLGTLRFRVDTERVDQLVFAPDGKTLAAASTRGLWLLDAVSGKPRRVIHPADTWFHRVAFSPDGKQLLTSATMQLQHGPATVAAQIWEVADGHKATEVKLENVCGLGWSEKGQAFVACLAKGEIVLYEIATGRTRRFAPRDLPDSFQINGFLGGPLANFHCVIGKKVLAAGDTKGAIHVWDMTKGEELRVLKTGGDLTGGMFVNSLALSADERWLAALTRGAANKITVQRWDLTTGEAAPAVAADQKYLHAVAFTPDSKTLATIGWLDVRFWDAASGRERGRTKSDGRMFAAAVSFSPDSKTMAAAEMYCGALHLWDVPTGEHRPQPEGHSSHWLGTAAFSPDGQHVATNGRIDGTLRVWDAATGRLLMQVRRSPRSVFACAFSADGRTLYSCWDDKLIVSDAATGRELRVWKPDDPDKPNVARQLMGMYLSDDRRKLMAVSQSMDPQPLPVCSLVGWDTATRKQLFRRRLASSANFWIAVSVDAGLLALPAADHDGNKGAAGRGPMQLEDVQTGERLLTFPTLKGQTWPLVFSADGRLLISTTSGPAPPPAPGGWSQTLRVWEVLTASELLALPTTDGNAKAAISPDGRLLAAPTSDGQILVWDLRKGKERHRFQRLDAQVTSLAFSPDGRRLVSGLSDSTLLVWDVPKANGPAAKLDADGAAKAWADLASTHAPRAFRARGALASSPAEALPLLKEHLHPARSADAQRLRRLLADLESEQFAVREKAQRELEELGDLAEPVLRQALEGKPSLEMRRRVQAVLEHLRGPVTQPELLRSLRAVAVLEDIGTPEARGLLETLAADADEARQTREAKAALRRLGLH